LIYLDYAATSFVKPKSVYKAVMNAMMYSGANPGRGGHSLSVKAGEIVYETREKLCKFFHADTPEQFSFFPNTTAALNAGIKGVLTPGDHVVVSSMEHNSVARPLEALRRRGIITYSVVYADGSGHLMPEDFLKAMRLNTKLVICTHASNVCGNAYDIYKIARLVRSRGALFMADCAQSAGVLDVNVSEMDLMAFPGHKGLYGPQGSGGLYVREGLYLQTLIEGGTGSQSEQLYQPEELPDRLESGTLNVPAIAGLGAALDFVSDVGIKTMFNHEQELLTLFSEELKNMKEVQIYGDNAKTGIVAVNLPQIDCVDAATILSNEYNIAVRSGLHCAVWAHETLQTVETGCIRFSFGYFTTKKEVKKAVDAMYHLSKLTV